MRVCTVLLLAIFALGTFTRAENDNNHLPRECGWYHTFCRLIDPCWFNLGLPCEGRPDAVCRAKIDREMCKCEAEYYVGEEKIDCRAISDEPEHFGSTPGIVVPAVIQEKGCEPVECDITCLDGYVKNSNGCDTCDCVEPLVRLGVCPTLAPEQVSTCGIECSSDAGCEGNKKCCSNGCGRVCVPACSEFMCTINCRPFGGFATDANGCEICRCKNTDPDMHCPVVDDDVLGSCVRTCEGDNECSKGEKCCSNGCGQTCVKACESIHCRLFCEHGYQTDEDNCQICRCKAPPGCPKITCIADCIHGFESDENGCQNCTCLDRPMPPVPRTWGARPRPKVGIQTFSRRLPWRLPGVCPSVEGKVGPCVLGCLTDENCIAGQKCCRNGCGRVCRIPCPSVMCTKACSYGFLKDYKGCDTCFCKRPQGKFGKCPVVESGVAGTCPSDCGSDEDCLGSDMKCCSNGCGRTCMTACSPVKCRIGCRHGYARDTKGCEICQCLPIPAIKPGQCPAIFPRREGGVCVTECTMDGDCAGDMKCCDSGCGRVCGAACPSFRCLPGCPFGRMTDENGCQICDCKPPPPVIPRVCPVVSENAEGNCEEDCSAKYPCPTGQMCCSNGCGHSCVDGCRPVMCRMRCPYRWQTDENGCKICRCKRPPTAISRVCPVVTEESGGICVDECSDERRCPTGMICCSTGCGKACVAGCRPVLCRMHCQHGWETDENDCEICRCKRPTPDCRPLLCRLGCRRGYQKDENGCDICKCRTGPGLPPPQLGQVCPVVTVTDERGGICPEECNDVKPCRTGKICCSNGCGRACMDGCRPVTCRMYCRYGWDTDENGCEICACKQSPIELKCPRISSEIGGICSEECQLDDECENGEKCCSNGCGHVCTEGCRPVLCRMRCRHGWARNERGCEICRCAEPLCPLRKCESDCPHGFAMDENRCQTCECLPAVFECPEVSTGVGGVCVQECGENKPCAGETEHCCFNGCGHVCIDACPQRDCDSDCPNGFMKDVNGCPTCECKPSAVELVCPRPREGTFGTCMTQCIPNTLCGAESQKCCFNGCGYQCMTACPPLNCSPTGCQYGHAIDENGCEMCDCKSAPEVTAEPQCSNNKVYQTCGSVCPWTCEMHRSGRRVACISVCRAGCFCPPDTVLDWDGSCVAREDCGCMYDADGDGTDEYYQLDVPFTARDQRCRCSRSGVGCVSACPPVNCGLTGCQYGHAQDENGCETCNCNTAPQVTEETECPDSKVYKTCGTACPMTCEMHRSGLRVGCIKMCVAGCFCPTDTVLDSDGSCVAREDCGCMYDADGDGTDEYYQLGAPLTVGSVRCRCSRSGVECMSEPSGIPVDITVKPDSSTSILVKWKPPPGNARKGLIIGYKLECRTIGNAKRTNSLLIDNARQQSYIITGLERGTGYEVRMAAYNGNGTGPYSDWYQTSTFVVDRNGTATPSTPIGLQALVTSPFAAVLTWTDLDYTPEEKPHDRYYTVKYTTNYPTSNKYMYINSSESSVVIRNLSPFTSYQFEVMAVSGQRHSDYSLVVENKTFEAAPGSAPRSLTVIDVENSTTAVILTWLPPKSPNGQISGYTIYYSTTNSQEESDWIPEFFPGDDMTRTLRDLTSDTTYYFKIRAHTSKGEGPQSDVVHHTTPAVPVVVKPPVHPEPTSPAPLADAAAMGFPWWLWLVIILVILFIIIIAVLLLLCFMCGCCACCMDCCPCCAAACEDICSCCAPLCGPLAACFAACCPCCCEDEDDCAKCWLKCCCGATACVCCGQAYRERRKSKTSANLVGYHAVSQNGKVLSSTGDVPPDLWMNHGDFEMKKLDGKTMVSPVSSKTEERERLDQGGGVDQQRDHIQETKLTQSSIQIQQELEEQAEAANRQSQYETPTLLSAASHRSSLESDLHVSGNGSGAVHYATVDEMHTARKKSNLRQSKRQDAETLFAEPPIPPPDYGRIRRVRSPHSNLLLDIDILPMGSSAEDFARRRVPSVTISPAQSHVQSLNRSEVQSRAAGKPSSSRSATWGAKANQNDRQQSSVNYNTTNIHVEDIRNNYTTADGYSTLHDGGYQGSMDTSGQAYSTLDRQTSYNNAHANPNQLITFPDQNAGPQPLTITFEETTTSHTVEKAVPLPDGTSYKTSTSHQTFAKSYSTSDAANDHTLQSLLQGGIENGPLAVEIPSTANTSLPAITAAPMLRSASFNLLPQDNLSQSSGPSNTLGRSPPPPSYNFVTSENASSQTHSSGYASGTTNTRGRTSSIGASSVDSTGYRSRVPESSYLSAQDTRRNMFTTSPINIPPRTSSPLSSGFQNYESYRSDDLDYGRGASDLYVGSSGGGITRPRAGYHTIDRATGLNVDSAYGSPTGFSNGVGSYSGASTLGKLSGGLSVPSAIPGNSYQSSAFQNTESFRAYNSNIGNGGPSDFSFNNDDADVMMPSRFVEVEHAEVQTPSRFNSKSDLFQSVASSPGSGLDFMTPSRPLRRSMSVDNEFGLENDGYWSSSSNTNLLSGYRTQRESKESRMSETLRGPSEPQRGRSRFVGDRTYGGLSSRSRSLDRFGEREVKIQAPAYSPLKRTTQPGVARVRAQPLPVVTPRAPDVTYRGVGDGTSPGTANRSFSTEDLNTEMLNLEGLMKDLNAITASELQS